MRFAPIYLLVVSLAAVVDGGTDKVPDMTRDAPDAGMPVSGHIWTSIGSVTVTASRLSGPDVDLMRDSHGEWRGTIKGRAVDAVEATGTFKGDPKIEVSGTGVGIVLVHHDHAWYARGVVFSRPIRVIWPDNQALDSWRAHGIAFNFDGIAALPNPPIVSFVLGLYCSSIPSGRAEAEMLDLEAR